MAIYELFDRQSANQIGTYETGAQAIAIVQAALSRGARSELATVALGIEDEDGNTRVIAAGDELIKIALSELPSSFREGRSNREAPATLINVTLGGLPSPVTKASGSAHVRNGTIGGNRKVHANAVSILSNHGS